MMAPPEEGKSTRLEAVFNEKIFQEYDRAGDITACLMGQFAERDRVPSGSFTQRYLHLALTQDHPWQRCAWLFRAWHSNPRH